MRPAAASHASGASWCKTLFRKLRELSIDQRLRPPSKRSPRHSAVATNDNTATVSFSLPRGGKAATKIVEGRGHAAERGRPLGVAAANDGYHFEAMKMRSVRWSADGGPTRPRRARTERLCGVGRANRDRSAAELAQYSTQHAGSRSVRFAMTHERPRDLVPQYPKAHGSAVRRVLLITALPIICGRPLRGRFRIPMHSVIGIGDTSHKVDGRAGVDNASLIVTTRTECEEFLPSH